MTSLRARILSWPALAGLVAIVAVAYLAGPTIARTAGLTGSETAADQRFEQVCRDHGGTPELAPGSGDYVKDGRSCEIEYAGDSYEMYAVHPEGFSEREAAAARHSCRLLAAQKRSDAKAAGADATKIRVVWHQRSAICESQP